jgi:hypothetical protein
MSKKDRKPRGYWTVITVTQQATKYRTRYAFQKGAPSAYIAARKLGILDQVCAHMSDCHISWSIQLAQEIADKYKERGVFRNSEPKAYEFACKHRIVDKLCAHMVPAKNQAYSDREIIEEALLHPNRKSFENHNPSAYNAARKGGNHFMDKICAHMEKSKTKAYLDVELRQQALESHTRGEFAKKNWGAYQVALKRGMDFMDDICSHMKPAKGPSIAETELMLAIKQVYPNTKKIRLTKLEIPDKPYIRRFELDIFVPELNLSIGYDGDYYHSYQHMRADPTKAKWSDEDVLNYHEIKDAAALSRGIKVLHIKERDWDKDKQACIEKCFQFLGT